MVHKTNKNVFKNKMYLRQMLNKQLLLENILFEKEISNGVNNRKNTYIKKNNMKNFIRFSRSITINISFSLQIRN